ncbi:MAG: pyridoxal phosphate-dependent aminotransferase [Salinivirgaceae bacterium]|jgi:cystathionine beta-lyase|nr:pyridoxal phosphate-dependent aminotransferase [Salinivirgaceae bacterium]
MKYNFDEQVNRNNTNCIKHDGLESFLGVKDVIPMWVADMDFKSPSFIIDAIKKRLEHEVLGYSIKPDEFYQSIINWLDKKHQWKIEKDWISFSPGVVAGFTLAIEQFTKPGDKIIVQPPVYFPFFDSVKNTNRIMVENPLKLEDGRLNFDFEDLKNKIDSNTKLLLLCNPHNPGGSVWTKDELLELSKICVANNVLVVSDEIHADIVYAPAKHIPYATISDEAAQNSLTVMSHSKTFNVAGLTTSFVISANNELLVKYNRGLNTPHLHMGNIFGTEALIAAYSHGEEWLAELILYLKSNIDYVDAFFKEHLPKIKVIVPESTFLIWIDCRELGLSGKELSELFLKKAKVAVNEGSIFGLTGEGFMRMNIGCTKETVKLALNRINEAFNT